jgi:hypothetical protein
VKRIPFILLLIVQSFSLTVGASSYFGLAETKEFSALFEEENEEEGREAEKFEEHKHKKSFDDYEDAEVSESDPILFSHIEHCAYKAYLSTNVQHHSRLYILFHQLKSEL